MTHQDDLLSIRDRLLAEGILTEDVTYLPDGGPSAVIRAVVHRGEAHTSDFDSFGGGRNFGRAQREQVAIEVSVADVPTPGNRDKFFVVPNKGGAAVTMGLSRVLGQEDGWWMLEVTP